jgi:hypothetical protein
MSDPAARKLTYARTWEGITVAAARTADRAGLSPSELEHIRDALAGGRRPKVVFTAAAGQIAGQQGQVVELIDPAVNDEWVVVRFGHDELPFSPADLAIPSRGTGPRRATKTAPTVPPAATLPPGPPLAPGLGGAPALARPVNSVPTPREESTVTRPASTAKTTSAKSTTAKAPGAKATAAAAKPADTKPADTKPADTKPADTRPTEAAPAAAAPAAPAESQAAARPAKAPARKAGRAKAPATLTVTLTYSDGEWMVGAQQGSKALAKPYVIRAAEALKMVGMLDVPGVHEAVEEIVSSARAEAEAAADKLRAELAEIEARLAELREAG